MTDAEMAMYRHWTAAELAALGFAIPEGSRFRGFGFFATADPIVQCVTVTMPDGSIRHVAGNEALEPWSEMVKRTPTPSVSPGTPPAGPPAASPGP